MTLDDAWDWYETTRRNLERFGRFGRKHWNRLDWSGPLGNDDQFRTLESQAIEEGCRFSREHLDDFAILIV